MNLKELRKQHNLTQEDLAKDLGILRETVARWEAKGTISNAYKKILTQFFNQKAMKNLIILLAMTIIFCSCKKHKEDPISKYGTLHIEYTATQPTFSGVGFQSKVQITFSNKSPIEVYSDLNKANVITTDLSIQGDQQITVNGFVIDSIGCGSSQSNVPVAMKLTYNGHVISDKTSSGGRCAGNIQYNGKLEFVY